MSKCATPICPKCDKPAKNQPTQFGWRHECCGLHSWGGRALVSQSTHDARRIAHACFDKLWKEGLCGRNRAYRLLAEELGIPEKAAHMTIMFRDLARRVPLAVGRIRDRLLDHESKI